MAPSSSLTSRLKVQLKLSISRLRMIQQKDTALAKQQRRAMAQLLEQSKVESARIRVENIIRSDILTELHEILELYCELLLARIQLLDAPTGGTATPPASPRPNSRDGVAPIVDPALDEAIRSLIHAAPRTEVKELQTARALLMEKAGKEASVAAMDGVGVADRVLQKLRLETPSVELVNAYLTEIARTYGIDWRPAGYKSEGEEDDDDDEGGGGIKEPAEAEGQREDPLPAEPLKAEELSRATPPRNIGPASPVRVAPPSPSTENVAPKVRLPGPPELKPGGKMLGKGKSDSASAAANATVAAKGSSAKKGASSSAGDGPGGKIPDVDELAKRFAALKR